MSRWLFRAAVSVLVAVLLLAFIPVDAVLDALRRVSAWAWAASLGIFFGGHYLNAVKLRLLLGPDRPPMTVCVQAQYAGLAANLGLPGLAGGDIVRAGYLVPAAGLTRVTVATIADRVLDTVTLLALVAVALPVAGIPPPIAGVVRQGAWWLGIAGLAGALVVAAGVWLVRRGRLGRSLPELQSLVTERWPVLARAAVISLGVQAAFVLTNVWLARQVGVTAGLAAWFVAWPLSKLVAVLPISLGGIGVREAALVALLAPYGASGDAVLASGILWQGVLAVSGLTGLVITQGLRRRTVAAPTPGKAQ